LGAARACRISVLVVVKDRHRVVPRHRVELLVDREVVRHDRLEVGAVFVFVDELLNGRDFLGVDHEAGAEVVDLHQLRSVAGGDRGLDLREGVVVASGEDRRHFDLAAVRVIELLHQGVGGVLVGAGRKAMPESDFDRLAGRRRFGLSRCCVAVVTASRCEKNR